MNFRKFNMDLLTSFGMKPSAQETDMKVGDIARPPVELGPTRSHRIDARSDTYEALNL